MFNFIKEFRESSGETKLFTLTVLGLGFIVIGISLFAFLRLDYVRSYKTPVIESEK